MSDVPEIVVRHGNSAVVRIPGRRFPGIWIAADSLSIWLDWLEEAEFNRPADEVADVAEHLRAILVAYSHELQIRGEALPFVWPRPTIRGARRREDQ